MPDTRPSIPWVYAVCNDIGPSRATVDRILTADELREQLDDLGDNERVLVVEAGTHAAGDRLRVALATTGGTRPVTTTTHTVCAAQSA